LRGLSRKKGELIIRNPEILHQGRLRLLFQCGSVEDNMKLQMNDPHAGALMKFLPQEEKEALQTGHPLNVDLILALGLERALWIVAEFAQSLLEELEWGKEGD
jgi:hypothetical protein